MELSGKIATLISLGCKIMSERTGIRSLSLLFVLALFFFTPASRAQTESEEPKGTDAGNYHIQQTAEVGLRQDWINGNQNQYNTFVNLHEGVRLLDYTLNMRSLNHQGLLFDNLNFSNFGYGGDPGNVSRLRVQKNNVYSFSAVFRRHKNLWDYSLLANPLNPVQLMPSPSVSPIPAGATTLTNPTFAINQSPHSLVRTRRMQDYDLTLLPQSRVRFRLGFSHYVNEGPSFGSFHGTTDFLVQQNFLTTMNSYRAGVDFRFLPKTTISYDQFLEWDKVDTNYALANTPYQVSTGGAFPGTLATDMGLNWYYAPAGTTSQTCNSGTTGNIVIPFPSGYPGFANPNCKQYASYARFNPQRNFMPTERLSFQSTFIPRFEMSGAASYSQSKNTVSNLYDFADQWTGSSTSRVRDLILSGPASVKQIFAHANWTGMYSLTNKIRIIDSLRYDNWRSYGGNSLTTTNVFLDGTAGVTGILVPPAPFGELVSGAPSFASICPSPYTAVTCP